MTATLISFIIYLFVLLLVGLLTYRITKTLGDFILAGRRLGTWVTAISAKASDMSGWLILGVPGIGYNNGIGAMWVAIGVIAGTFLNWTVIASRLRRYTQLLGALTLPDFFEARFRDERVKILRLISAIVIVVFMTAYLAAQFVASGKVLSATFELSYNYAMILGAAVILFYTIMGGFFAVAWTDLVQGLLMLAALVVLPAVGIVHVGGGSTVVEFMEKTDPNLLSTFSGNVGWAACAFAIGLAGFIFGYPGQPHILARYMAIRDPRKLRQGTLISMIWVIVVMYGAIGVGMIGRCLLTDVDDPEQIFALMAGKLLPGWLAGALIAAAMAAIMSTADSQLLVAAGSIVEDFYCKLLGKKPSEKALLIISRVATLLIGLVAILLARPRGGVFKLVEYAWGGLAASFGPAVVMSLYWKRTTKWAVAAGMLTGMVTVIVWKNVEVLGNTISLLIPGFIFPLIVIWLVSLFTKPPSGIDDEFEAMKRPLPTEGEATT